MNYQLVEGTTREEAIRKLQIQPGSLVRVKTITLFPAGRNLWSVLYEVTSKDTEERKQERRRELEELAQCFKDSSSSKENLQTFIDSVEELLIDDPFQAEESVPLDKLQKASEKFRKSIDE